MLLSHGASVTKPMLNFAASGGHCDVAQLLLDHGADVNYCDQHGHTPLFHAASQSFAMVELLIKHGADVHSMEVQVCLFCSVLILMHVCMWGCVVCFYNLKRCILH
eukprot:m.128911 g.128911  ORF g.128911 m.128911 type:complete len:106 (-) comp23615_c0_seq2:90-407(-)